MVYSLLKGYWSRWVRVLKRSWPEIWKATVSGFEVGLEIRVEGRFWAEGL